MIPSYVALIALTDKIRAEELACVAAALQTQVTRDFAPVWHQTVVIAAASLDAIPAGYVPIIVHDTLEAGGVNGFHRTHSDDTPYIIVPYGPSWPLAASHELLRMLANPTGSLRRPGPSRMSGQGTVEYLADVCSPCQHVNAAYSIDGVAVSDFCMPQFFRPTGRTEGSAFSFTGSVTEALEPGRGGVVTWLADDGLLYQARSDVQSWVQVHGGFSPAMRGRMLLRELVDRLTPDRLSMLSNAPLAAHLLEAERNASRSRFTNMTRFQEDLAWRFGHASRVDTKPRRQKGTVRFGAFPVGVVGSGQPEATQKRERTLRTVS